MEASPNVPIVPENATSDNNTRGKADPAAEILSKLREATSKPFFSMLFLTLLPHAFNDLGLCEVLKEAGNDYYNAATNRLICRQPFMRLWESWQWMYIARFEHPSG